MEKIKITATKAQTMTAKEINALAQHILNRKGQVDFAGTSLAITPPDDMDADMAGIIVKCATENGGTVNISGATEITDEDWEVIINGILDWQFRAFKNFGIPLSILTAGEIQEGYQLASSYDKYKRSDVISNASTEKDNYVNLKYSSYQSWGEAAFGGCPGGNCAYIYSTYMRITQLPTKLCITADDYGYLYINGTLVATNYNSTFDFSNYLTIGEVAHIVAVSLNGGGGYSGTFYIS